MEALVCCGRFMIPHANVGRFVEVGCHRCGDVVYVDHSNIKEKLRGIA